MPTNNTELAFTVDPGTKRLKFKWVNGDVAFDDTMTETVMSLLVENEGPFTTNRRRGPGPLSIGVDTADSPSQIKARAEERLQLAIDDGRLQSFAVEVERPERGKILIGVSYVTRSGYQGLVQVPIGA